MSRRHRGFVSAVLTLGLALAASGCLFDPPRDIDVNIPDGKLRGVADDGIRTWLGVPYAAPPVGDLRWQPPQPVEPWEGERSAEHFENECTQPAPQGGVTEDSSEDCLYLNVFRPDTDAKNLPVMVWLHGGGLVLGNGDLPIKMAGGLVDKGVVVVSLNYRLGRFGYFAHPALAAEAEANGEEPVGNFGLLDQVAALEWVQDNIGEFGGDADQVTVFGISAGGASVNFLMSSPLGEGLFDRAISGSGLGREQTATWAAAAAQGEAQVAAAGEPGADAATLRDLDAETIAVMPASQVLGQIPMLDRALPASVADTFAAGDELPVPYISGTTDVELSDALYPSVGVANPAGLKAQLIAGRLDEARAAYGGPEEFGLHFLNDMVFTEPSRHLTELHADDAPTYRYRFAIANDQTLELARGAVHGSDRPYVFGLGYDKELDNSQELADGVSGCWASFAKGEELRCDGVAWPLAETGALLDFTNDGPEVVTTDPWTARLDLAEEIADSRP